MPTIAPTFQFLQQLLEGHQPTAPDIQRLVDQRIGEDVWLDYKRFWEERDKPTDKLRQHVAGFANSDGGVLLLGVAGGEGDAPWQVPGVPTRIRNPVSWASNVLKDLAPRLAPQPKIYQVDFPEGAKVLVIAVARAEELVPLVRDGRIHYFIRVGDSTLPVEPWLHADLTLGRRRRPAFSVEGDVRCGGDGRSGVSFAVLNLQVENTSFQWADDVRVGVLGVCVHESVHYQDQPHLSVEPPGPTLRSYATILGAEDRSVRRCEVRLRMLEALSHGQVQMLLKFPNAHVLGPSVGPELSATPAVWRGGLYVFSRDVPPTWWQIDARFDAASSGGTLGASVERLPAGQRPEICWMSASRYAEFEE